MLQTTVSDCHLAQRCSRLLARLRAGNKNAWKVGLDGNGDLPGKLFHDRFAAPFHEDMSSDPSRRDAFADCLQEPNVGLAERITLFLRDHYLVSYLEEGSKSLTDVQTLTIAESMTRWGEVMGGFLRPLLERNRNCRELVAQVFHPPERLLRAEHTYEDGEALTVTGRYDALLLDPSEREAVVLDFKGRRPTHPCEDFTQIILYAWFIQSATGITPRGLILYLEEDEDLAEFSVEDVASGIGKLRDLFDIVRDVLERERDLPCAVDARLCEICFYRDECGREGKAPAGKTSAVKWATGNGKSSPELPTTKATSSGTASPEDQAEGQAALSRLCEMLGRIKLPVEPVGVVVGPRFLRLRVRPELEKGMTVNKLVNRAVDLQVALDLKSPPLIQARQGHVSLDLPRASREPLTLSTLLEDNRGGRPKSTGAFPLGMTIDGRVYWADLAEPTMTSILIGGTSGSGKSVLLQSIVAGLGLCAPPASVRFVLIDPKRVTFPHFADLPCVETPLYLDAEPALKRLSGLVDEMEDRYRLLEENAVPDLRAYNEQADEPLFRYVVIIDEYADMILDHSTRSDLETCIQRIGQKGRAAGFHLVLATQRPDAKVVTGVIKANLQLKNVGNYRHFLENTRWDCVVIDEAHNVARASVPERHLAYRLARLLSRRTDSMLLTTAMPHNGRRETFGRLISLLDPSALPEPDFKEYSAEDIKGFFLMRFKEDVREDAGESLTDRMLVPLKQTTVAATPEEESVYEILVKMRKEATQNKTEQAWRNHALLQYGIYEQFLLDGYRYLAEQNEDYVSIEETGDLMIMIAPKDLRRRLGAPDERGDVVFGATAIPVESWPDHHQFRLTHNSHRVDLAIQAARNTSGYWSKELLCTDQHPILGWITERLLMLIERGQCPYITSRRLTPGELCYCFIGQVSSRGGSPLVVDAHAISFRKGGELQHRSLQEALEAVGFDRLVNEGQTGNLQAAQMLIRSAVEASLDRMRQLCHERVDEVAPFVRKESRRLRRWKNRRRELLERRMQQYGERHPKARQYRKALQEMEDYLRDRQENWLEPQFTPAEEPSTQLVLVVEGK